MKSNHVSLLCHKPSTEEAVFVAQCAENTTIDSIYWLNKNVFVRDLRFGGVFATGNAAVVVLRLDLAPGEGETA